MPSPDGNEKPGGSCATFSWYKRATAGSSFYTLEKERNLRGLVMYSWELLLIQWYNKLFVFTFKNKIETKLQRQTVGFG